MYLLAPFFFLSRHNDKYLLFRPYRILRLQNKYKNVVFCCCFFPTLNDHSDVLIVYSVILCIRLYAKQLNIIKFITNIMLCSVKYGENFVATDTYHVINGFKFKIKYNLTINIIYLYTYKQHLLDIPYFAVFLVCVFITFLKYVIYFCT